MKRSLLERFKRLSKPSGSPQWGHAARAIILMVIAGLIAKFLGFDNGIRTIMIVTLLASIIIDISLPIRKVAILTLSGFIMTNLAFISASLALSSLEVFIFFTVLWAFFSISMYIFGTLEGSLGFTFFLIYFIAVLMVNNQISTLDWSIYSTLSYLVASILFIPKIWLEKKKIRNMVTVGFIPGSSIRDIIYTRNILSGIPINSNYFDIFKLGSYLKSFRSYGNLISSRLTPESRSLFKKFLNLSDEIAINIADHFRSNKGIVDLKEFNIQVSKIESHFLDNNSDRDSFVEVSHGIVDILHKSNSLLSKEPKKTMMKIKIPKKTLKEVLRANYNLNNLYIRHALRFTLAITVSMILIYLTRERNVIWVTMGILIILKPDITSTIDNLISRVGYNFFAIILAIIISVIFPHSLLVWLAFIMLFLFRAFYPNYMGLSVLAITVFIVLIWPTGTVFDNAIARLVDIAFGGLIAFTCAYIILPSRITVNLPDQLIRTIKANIEYANQILATKTKNFEKEKVIECFKNYMREENNLEAALKKLEDSFKDINEDLELYQGIIASNNKLAADLTAMAALLNKHRESSKDLERNKSKIKNALKNLDNFINGNLNPANVSSDTFSNENEDKNETTDLEQIIRWIISDLHLIQNYVELANETGILQRYIKLT